MTGGRARWAAMLGVAAVVSASLAATGWLAPASSKSPAAQDQDACTILQAENERDGAPTTLRLLALPGGATQRLTQAGFWINAMGYSAAQDVVYGVADGTRGGRYEHGAHAVRIDSAGAVTDLGVLGRAGARARTPWSLVTGATAGAIAGNRWYVRQDSDLYTVDVDPGSADYVRVVHRTALRPVSLAVGVDDFAYDPADGLLYGVSTTSRGGDSVVTLDPATGQVAAVPGLRLPSGGAYGSVVLGPGALYATANREGHRSVTYRLPRDGSGPAVEIATGPALVSGDAAGCVAGAAPSPPPMSSATNLPPPSPTPTPSQTPPPPPPPTAPRSAPAPPPSAISVPAPPPPTHLPPVEQPIGATTVPAPAPAPAPVVTPTPSAPVPSPRPSSPHARPAEKIEPVPADTGRRTQWKRRWGLTALILVLGGGAAAAHRRRHR